MLSEAISITPEGEALLARAMFPDVARIRHTLATYRAEPTRRVFARVVAGRPVSAAGVRQRGGRGYARALLHALAAHLQAELLVAETVGRAVGCYRRAGFEVTPIPSPWPGARFRCVLTLP